MPNFRARNDDGSNFISGPLAAGAGLYNPLEILDKDSRNNNTQKAIGSIYGEYNILPNLKISSKYGIDYNNIEEDYIIIQIMVMVETLEVVVIGIILDISIGFGQT